MWRWTVFLYFLIFYGHTSSQPVTDDSENSRQTRQLDFGECCPCTEAGQDEDHDFRAEETDRSTGRSSFTRARDMDECPCRSGDTDSDGASSIFSPTSMRADGPFVRPAEKKEDLKPLLHPEVDLASSVLQTLREVTDEEYQDALTRDAARSLAIATEGTEIRDSIPEASTGSIVTIIMNPKEIDSEDDIIPHQSCIHESRCIHAPIESVKNNFAKMRVPPKSPSLLHDIFGLPRISKPTGILHRNLLDKDSNVGASDIQEHVVPMKSNQVTNKSLPRLTTFAPIMKVESSIQDNLLNIKSKADDDCSVNKIPDFKPTSVQNKLKDWISSRSSLGRKNKTTLFPPIPKIKSDKSLFKPLVTQKKDSSFSPNNIQEQIEERKPYFKSSSNLENILEKTKSIGLKNLFKLKDVELVPLKDMVNAATDQSKLKIPKFDLPIILNKREDVILDDTDNHTTEVSQNLESIGTLSKMNKAENIDSEVSPSHIISQVSDDYCDIKTKSNTDVDGIKDGTLSTEILDTAPSPSDIQSVVNNDDADLDHSNEINQIETGVIKTLDFTEINQPQLSSETCLDNQETRDLNEDKFNSGITENITADNMEVGQYQGFISTTSEEDCENKNKYADSITDSSISESEFLKNTDNSQNLFAKNQEISESDSLEQQAGDTLKPLESNSNMALLNPSFDRTISTIKNIMSKLESRKKLATSERTSNTLKHQTSSDIIENTSPLIEDENQDTDCQNEEFIQVTIPDPDISNNENGNESSDKISMQDLQEISNLMLQQEDKNQQSKTADCNEPSEIVIETNVLPSELSRRKTMSQDLENSASSKHEIVLDPQSSADTDDIKRSNFENICQSDLTLSNQDIDADTDASDVKTNRISQSNKNVGSPLMFHEIFKENENDFSFLKTSLPDIQDVLNIPPLPTLDDFKLRLSTLFDNSARNTEKLSTSKADSMPDTSITANYRSRLSPLRLEDVNLDILQLKPQSRVASNIPKIDLHSYKSRLPWPKDLQLKPMKLQSALEDKGNLLGASLTVGHSKGRSNHNIPNYQLESSLSLDNFRPLSKLNTHHLKTHIPLRADNLRNSLTSSQGLIDFSDNINSHAKKTWRNMQQTLESKLREATNIPTKLQSHDFLEVISRNHEDVSDKLKALHIDFNDRLETLRNNFLDKPRIDSQSRNRKPNMKSFSSFSNQKKGKQSSQPKLLTNRRESKKTESPRRYEHKTKVGVGQKTFKMPTAASVPVPKTIEVPELKTTLRKTPGIAAQKAGLKPFVETPQAKESSVALWKQASKNLRKTTVPLGKQINPFKDSKIKVSFSPTPVPTVASKVPSRMFTTTSSHLRNKNTEKTGRVFGTQEDHSGSPSEVKHLIISPTSRNVDDIISGSKNTGLKDNLDATQPRKYSELQSWPLVSESAFLSKVKEAVKARLAKVNSSGKLNQIDGQSNVGKRLLTEDEETFHQNTKTDMARSASENMEIIDGQSLKENVSYTCTMVCTKAQE